MQKLTPRLLTAQNHADAVQLADACFTGADDRNQIREAYQRIVEGQREYVDEGTLVRLHQYFLYYKEQELVGTTGLYSCDENYLEQSLGWFAVSPQHRRGGMGIAMLEHISELAALSGAEKLTLFTAENENFETANRFYLSNGFALTGDPILYRAANVFYYSKSLTKPTLDLDVARLQRNTFEQALQLADLCFPAPADQIFLRSHWQRVLSGEVTYFCPDDQTQLTLLDHFVYSRNGSFVGFGGLYRHDDARDDIWLNWFGSDPALRQTGIGTTIMRHLSSVARLYGARTLKAYAEAEGTVDLNSFYQRTGFTLTNDFSFKGEQVALYERALSAK